MTPQAFIYFLSIVGIFIITLFMVMKRKSSMYGWFCGFSGSLALWMLFQYMVTSGSHIRFWLGLSFLASEIIVACFLIFAWEYTKEHSISIKRKLFAFLPFFIFGPLSFTEKLLLDYDKRSDITSLVLGPLYYLQTASIIGFMVLGIGIIIQKRHSLKPSKRSQINLLISALLIPFLTLGVTGLIYFDSVWVEVLRPLSVLAMVVIISYAIIYKGLFDIHLFLARAVAHLLSVLVLIIIYGLAVIGIIGHILHIEISFVAQVVLSIMLGFVAVTYRIIQRAFDKLTTRIFYHDAYEPQEVINKLNKLLVSTIDIHRLMRDSSQIIAENMKISYCLLVIEQGSDKYREVGNSLIKYETHDLRLIKNKFLKYRKEYLAYDELDEGEEPELYTTLQKYDTGMVLRLAKHTRLSHENIGYMILGTKMSGSSYTKQDHITLEVLTNELVLALQNAMNYEEIQKFNALLQNRVDEATRKLRRTNTKLKSLDETKDDFISMASHQLRTPLTSVKGYLSMVLEGDAGEINETQRKMLGQAFVSSQRMVYLIADLLNVSRLRTGKFIIEPTPLSLADMVSEEIEQLTETAAARGIELTYQKPKQFPELMLDETKTRQVVMNFVDNAIYYTPPGGHIKVDLYDGPHSVELKVIDDGIGVPKSEQHHLFTKFYRAGNARKARPDGTGLGLYMAKKVVLAQGGSVLFESAEGKGSTFGFTFPKDREHKPTPHLPVTEAIS